MSTMMFFTLPQAERLTGLSRGTIRRWQDLKVFVPAYPKPLPFSGAYRRIYTLRDVVYLKTLAILRNRYAFDLKTLRPIGAYLQRHRTGPWSDLRLWVIGGQDYVFADPHSASTNGRGADRRAIDEILLEPIARQIEQESRGLQERDVETIGRVSRHRDVMGNQWVIAGTRIPTAIVLEYHDAGYSTEEIISEYPDLHPEDVRAAIDHESERQLFVA